MNAASPSSFAFSYASISWSNENSRPPFSSFSPFLLPSMGRSGGAIFSNIALLCPPPPKVTSTYTPFGLIAKPSIVSFSIAGMWYISSIFSIYYLFIIYLFLFFFFGGGCL